MAIAPSGVEWRAKALAKSPSSVITCQAGHIADATAAPCYPGWLLLPAGFSLASGVAATPAYRSLLDSPRAAEAFYPNPSRPATVCG